MDKRRHPRLYINLPIRIEVDQPEIQEVQTGLGKLKNISYGGILFQVEPPLPVQPGQVREFSFFLIPEKTKGNDLAHFHAKGLILRIEPSDPNSSAYEVAVQFLSALKMEDVAIKMTVYSRRRVRTRSKPIQGNH